MSRTALAFPCDICREPTRNLDDQGRRWCVGCCEIHADHHCPVLDARCPWPYDCDGCQMQDD